MSDKSEIIESIRGLRKSVRVHQKELIWVENRAKKLKQYIQADKASIKWRKEKLDN